MELTVKYDKKYEVVITTPVAEITTENVRTGVLKTLEVAKKNKCNYLLFDLRKCPVGQSLVEGFLAMRNMENTIGLPYDFKVAIVYNPSIYPDERAQFIEAVVANRVNPPFKMFTKINRALKWLSNIKFKAPENESTV